MSNEKYLQDLEKYSSFSSSQGSTNNNHFSALIIALRESLAKDKEDLKTLYDSGQLMNYVANIKNKNKGINVHTFGNPARLEAISVLHRILRGENIDSLLLEASSRSWKSVSPLRNDWELKAEDDNGFRLAIKAIEDGL
jgi:hypothetical protein